MAKRGQEKRNAKKQLLDEVKAWSEANPEEAKVAFEQSAAEVIAVLRKISESAVAEASHRTGLAFDVLLTGLMESCKQMRADRGALALMGELRDRGKRVVIATDNMETFTRWTIPASGIGAHCDDILVSYALKALKKDKRSDGSSAFFGDYIQQHAIDPSQAILVDDSPRNAVVEEFGMQFAQVTPVRTVVAVLGELLSA